MYASKYAESVFEEKSKKGTIRKSELEKELSQEFSINGVVRSVTDLDTQTGNSFAYHCSANGDQLALFPQCLAASVSGLGVSVVNSDVEICSERHIPTNCAPIRA